MQRGEKRKWRAPYRWAATIHFDRALITPRIVHLAGDAGFGFGVSADLRGNDALTGVIAGTSAEIDAARGETIVELRKRLSRRLLSDGRTLDEHIIEQWQRSKMPMRSRATYVAGRLGCTERYVRLVVKKAGLRR